MSQSLEPPIRKVGVVAVVVRQGRLLVIQRSQMVRAPGWFCFPGGGMEPEESEEQTLIREIQEELGVAVQPLQKLFRSVTPWGVDLRWWLADLAEDAELVPHAAEVAGFAWHTVDELLALQKLLDSNRDFIAAWQRGEFEIAGLERGT
jgi:8-oxo-dGTP pyrophosphatase MutT (NUDIX family)